MVKEKNDSKPLVNEENLGSLLREYREISGYSLTQMAEALCLSDETLKNLENEELHTLPEPPYVRGYLRNYAKLADKDPAQLINLYESLRGADPSDLDYHFKAKPTILANSKRKMSPVVGQLLLLSLLLALLVGISMIPAVNKWISDTWNSFSEQTRQQDNLNNPDLMGSMPVPTPLTIEEKTTEQNTQQQTAETTDSQSTDKNKVQETPTEKPAPPTQTPEQVTAPEKTPENQNTANSDTIHIKLIFNKEVWMKVKDGTNKTVFEGLNAAGGTKDLNLKKPLHFRVGNAQGLSLFVDDQPVDISSYIKGSVAKFTLE